MIKNHKKIFFDRRHVLWMKIKNLCYRRINLGGEDCNFQHGASIALSRSCLHCQSTPVKELAHISKEGGIHRILIEQKLTIDIELSVHNTIDGSPQTLRHFNLSTRFLHIRAAYSDLKSYYLRTCLCNSQVSDSLHTVTRAVAEKLYPNIEPADLIRTISNPILNSDDMAASNPATSTSAKPENNTQQPEDSTQQQVDSLEDPDFIGLEFVASDMGGVIPLQVFKQSLFRVASDNYLTPKRIERFPGRPLFVYGSLIYPYSLAESMHDLETPVTKFDAAKVALSMTPAGLQGYRQLKGPDDSIVAITNEGAGSDDIVPGMVVFGVTSKQVQCLDRHHNGKYSREPVHVETHVRCHPNGEELEMKIALVHTYIWVSDEKLAVMSPGKSLPGV